MRESRSRASGCWIPAGGWGTECTDGVGGVRYRYRYRYRFRYRYRYRYRFRCRFRFRSRFRHREAASGSYRAFGIDGRAAAESVQLIPSKR